ncbi:MAG: bifunctional (p)ppGpp synthetase/guanosine-3',5'-bis(diphosphate) 3'-pyrophosphohydrolase [Candidatus Niyogibacteria bacterium]|nr:MAG: bifunctional (p)ppGpp synthetase/guanosine-3',5'-bis(diphosphate) 3'-pyrophosphohydrolase [Candidatus Niyogibacteria bacterium]
MVNASKNLGLSWSDFEQKLLAKNRGRFSKDDLALIKKAFEYASEAHRLQTRLTGEAYINHVTDVALDAASLKLDVKTVSAALLHDTVEDNVATMRDIKKKFGDEIAFLVRGVTKVDKLKYHGVERAAESMRRMFLAVAEDIRVVVLKLVDRLNNMKTLYVLPSADKQRRIATETLEIYASLADRLGMGEMKNELEDLAFRYVYPQEYEWVKKEVGAKIPEREKYLKKIMPVVKKELAAEHIKPLEVSARAKHYYSTWKKLLRYEMNWGKVLDLVALRIIVKNVEDCYSALGVIHKLWKPMPGRIKDYIALPKLNGYKSIHTTVFCLDGQPTEFQIRTEEMHREAEYGIAAHWFWDEAGKPRGGAEFKEQKFAWVKQLQSWQKEFEKEQNSEEFLESLKIDFFKDRIFVLTPKGDVVDLPEGATPVDFAYHVHSEIGNHAAGAKINSKMSPLSSTLSSGSVVEIITQKNKKPSAEWLTFVKTSLAKNRIKKVLGIIHPSKKIGEDSAELNIVVKNRVGVLKDITAVLATFRINIESVSSAAHGNDYPTITIKFRSKKAEQLERIKTRIKKISGVQSVAEKIKP